MARKKLLTSWERFSTRIVHSFSGGGVKKRARADKDLADDLAKARMAVTPEVFRSTVIVSTIVTYAALIVGAVFIHQVIVPVTYEQTQDPSSVEECRSWAVKNPNDIDRSKVADGCPPPIYYTREFGLGQTIILYTVVAFLIPFGLSKMYSNKAKAEVKRRSANQEKYLPYAASYTAAMAAANATPMKIFKSLGEAEDLYGEIAHDSAMIYRDMTVLGYDLLTAVKMAVSRSASMWVTEFFQGMVGTLSSGGNLKLYFLNRAETYMRENRTRLTEFLETLSLYAESYIVVAVAMPLFLIVMLVIMFWVSGSGAQLTEGFLYLVVLVAIPLIHVGYTMIVFLDSQEQKM